MISADAGLITFMETERAARRFDLYTFTLASGVVLRYTNCQAPITLPDSRSFAAGPLITRDRLRMLRGLEVDTLSITLMPRPADQLNGQALLQAALGGALRGCRVQLEWAYYGVDNVFKGSMLRFIGSASPTAFEAGAIVLNARSELERLQQQMPRDVYQPRCLNQVYDAGCGVEEATYQVAGTVTGSSPARGSFTASASPTTSGYFDLGVLRFTSGANNGTRRTVRSWDGAIFTFALPFPRNVAAGDTFVVSPGCDGTMATCTSRYNNLLRFRGQPFIPAAEVAT